MKIDITIRDASLDDVASIVEALSGSVGSSLVVDNPTPSPEPQEPSRANSAPVETVDAEVVEDEEDGNPPFYPEYINQCTTIAQAELLVKSIETKAQALDVLKALRDGGSTDDVANKHTATLKTIILDTFRTKRRGGPVETQDEQEEREAIVQEIADLTGNSFVDVEHELRNFPVDRLREELEAQRKKAYAKPVDLPPPDTDEVYTPPDELEKMESEIFNSSDMGSAFFTKVKARHNGDVETAVNWLYDNRAQIPAISRLTALTETQFKGFVSKRMGS